MRGLIAKLKEKGPLGMPIGFWLGFVVIAGYLGYRWYSNRSGGGGSSSAADSTPVDTTGAGSGDGSTPGFGDPNSATQTPDASATPDTSGDVVPGPEDTSTGISEGLAPESPKAKKKKHKGLHDHKQRLHHTAKKALHRRTKAHKQPHNAHAPKTHKKPPSETKKHVTKGVPSAHKQAAPKAVVHHPPTVSHPPHIRDDTKKLPPPVIEHNKAPAMAAKHPPAKHAAKRKRR